MTSEWSADQVKELLDRELAHHAELRQTDLRNAEELRVADQRAVDVKREADQKALERALQTVKEQRLEDRRTDENWREQANEWRGQSKDQAGTYLTRTEYDLGQRAASAALRNTMGLGMTALGLIISIVVIAANALIGK